MERQSRETGVNLFGLVFIDRLGKQSFYSLMYMMCLANYMGEQGVVTGLFGGRLGSYCYYDMDQVIRAALDAAEAEING